MATPNAKTKIANLALRHLKEDPVVSIDPPDQDSKAAKSMSDWYDQARRDTLEAHPWKFASKRLMVPADPVAPRFEYAKKFELPPDFIRVNRIGLDWDNPEEDYEIEDGFILCDHEGSLPLVYVYNLNDATKFSPKFITALSYKLAALAAYEITGNAELVGAMENQFSTYFTAAAAVNGQNRPTRRVQHSRIAAARQFGSRYKDYRRWGDD